MNQTDLDRAVARVTGESRTTVRRLGFQLATFRHYDRPARGPDGERLTDEPISSQDKGTTSVWALR